MKQPMAGIACYDRPQKALVRFTVWMGVVAGISAVAQETKLAYYAFDPSDASPRVRTVPENGDEAEATETYSILQVQASQVQASQELEQPLPDEWIPSSSDAPQDDFIFLDPPAPDMPAQTESLVEDQPEAAEVAEPAEFAQEQLMPAPLEEPFSELVPNMSQSPATFDVPGPLDAPVIVDAPLSAPVAVHPPCVAVSTSYIAAPAMMGDYFGGSFLLGSRSGAIISFAGVDRTFKVADNVSPVPQDRVFFNFNHLSNALLDINNVTRSSQRFTFGFEKTFCGGDSSVEVRVPFSSTLNSQQSTVAPDTRNTEIGNLAFALKSNLVSGRNWILSGGATMTVPTGDDLAWYQGTTLDLVVENDAVHIAPFLGYEVQPNRRCFAQAFVQADFDLNGNDVATSAAGPDGVLQDQNLLFIDAALGRWLYRSCDPCDCLTGVAAMAELHYTTTLNDADEVTGITNPWNRMDVLNATAGLNVQLGRTAFRVGGVAPLTDHEERLFDAGVIFQLNRLF